MLLLKLILRCLTLALGFLLSSYSWWPCHHSLPVTVINWCSYSPAWLGLFKDNWVMVSDKGLGRWSTDWLEHVLMRVSQVVGLDWNLVVKHWKMMLAVWYWIVRAFLFRWCVKIIIFFTPLRSLIVLVTHDGLMTARLARWPFMRLIVDIVVHHLRSRAMALHAARFLYWWWLN